MKKFLVYLFKSPKLIYQKINECEENFLKRFDENYKSRLALNSIFYTLLSIVFVGVVPALLSGLNINLFLVSSIPSLLYTAIYLFIYLRKVLHTGIAWLDIWLHSHHTANRTASHHNLYLDMGIPCIVGTMACAIDYWWWQQRRII